MISLQQISTKQMADMIVEQKITMEDIKNIRLPAHLQTMIIQYIPIILEEKIHNKLTTYENLGNRSSFQEYFISIFDIMCYHQVLLN